MEVEGRGTRAALVAAAAALLEQRGPEAVTLRAIGDAAGLSRAAPYRHFGSKEGLLDAVAAEGLRTIRTAMADSMGAHDAPALRLEAGLAAYLAAAVARPATYRLIYRREPTDESSELEAEGALTYRLLLSAVKDGGGANRWGNAPPVALTALLWSAVHGLVDLTLSSPGTAEKGIDDPRSLIRMLVRDLDT